MIQIIIQNNFYLIFILYNLKNCTFYFCRESTFLNMFTKTELNILCAKFIQDMKHYHYMLYFSTQKSVTYTYNKLMQQKYIIPN